MHVGYSMFQLLVPKAVLQADGQETFELAAMAATIDELEELARANGLARWRIVAILCVKSNADAPSSPLIRPAGAQLDA